MTYHMKDVKGLGSRLRRVWYQIKRFYQEVPEL